MFKSKIGAVFLVLALVAGSGAAADVVLGSSNNPTIELNERFAALLGAERKTMSSVRGKTLQRLVDDPEQEAEAYYSRERLNDMPVAKGGKEWACLREALYFEARGETIKGMFGVAEVILNRVDDRRYPSTVCGVVNQGTGAKFRCQFTYTCDGRPESMGDSAARELVGKVAKIMIDGGPRVLTGRATHYHTKAVNPRWSRVFDRTTTIGYHHFYRQTDQYAQR